jgi:hypothetical protein
MSANDFIMTLKAQGQVNGIAEDLVYTQECLNQSSGVPSTVLANLLTAATNAGDTAAATFFQDQINTCNKIADIGIPIVTTPPVLTPGQKEAWFLSVPAVLPPFIAFTPGSSPAIPGFISLAPIAPGAIGGIAFRVNNPTIAEIDALGMSQSLGVPQSSGVFSGGSTLAPGVNAGPGFPFAIVYPSPGQPIQAQDVIQFLANPQDGDTITFTAPAGDLTTPVVFTFRVNPAGNFDIQIAPTAAVTQSYFQTQASSFLNPSDLQIEQNIGNTALIMIAGSNYTGTAGNTINAATNAPTRIHLNTAMFTGGQNTSSTTVQQLVDGVNAWAAAHLTPANSTPCSLSVPADGTIALNGSTISAFNWGVGAAAFVTLFVFDGVSTVEVAGGQGL